MISGCELNAGNCSIISNYREFDLGLYGVELHVGERSAFYVPSVAITSRVRNMESLLSKLAVKAGLSPHGWRQPNAIIWRTTWEHFVDVPGASHRPLHLRRMRSPTEDHIDRRVIEDAVRLAQTRLVTVQQPSGLYTYCYLPLKDRVLARRPNLVRQAGCAHAMAWSAQHEDDDDWKTGLGQSASSALDWLFTHRETSPQGGIYFRDRTIDSYSRQGKLGTIALALLSLHSGGLIEGIAVERRRALRSEILSRQNSDGSFRCYLNTTDVSDDGTAQNYFPGEALFALAHEARQGEDSAEVAARRALPWYRALFRRSPRPAFVMWQTAAWCTFLEASLDGDPNGSDHIRERAAFVFELVDWLLPHQLDSGSTDRDLVGGYTFGRQKPDYSTATFTEATVRGYVAARRLGDRERARRYRLAAIRGLKFVRRLQVSPATSALFPNPSHTIGGTTRSLSDFMIRSDYDQHSITVMIAALEAPELLD